MKFDLDKLVRPNILFSKPYSSARDEFTGKEGVFLDANENPFQSAINRYPDPYQRELKRAISEVKRIDEQNVFIGNGSDEVLDLLFRVFCEPGKDKVVSIKPSYGMYNVLAGINDVELVEVALSDEFVLDSSAVLKAAIGAKLIFLCSPNNPTGNLLNRNEILTIIKEFDGIVVVDEAYIDFSNGKSLLLEIDNFPNVFVVQTLSKAYGMAGIRVGLGFGAKEVVAYLNKVKPPYNVNVLSQNFALARVNDLPKVTEEVMQILLERSRILAYLASNNHVLKIYRTDANFILFKVPDANKLYAYFVQNGVVVRNRTTQFGCENCLRVTIGTHEENERFIQLFDAYCKLV